MPESLLTILKFCFLGLLYLFFLRVVRAVWAEVSPAPTPVAAAVSAPAGRRTQSSRGRPHGTHLRVLEPEAQRGAIIDLADEVTMGRAAGCTMTLDDTFVSQRHARVFVRDGDVYLEDLGSTNGTYLNRKKVSGAVALRKGDRIQVGKTVMELAK